MSTLSTLAAGPHRRKGWTHAVRRA